MLELVLQSGHTLPVGRVSFSPNSRLLASPSADESIRLWDARDGDEIAVLRGHTGPVYRAIWSPSGDVIASGGWDRTVRLWDPRRRTCLRVLRDIQRHPTDVVVFSPDGRLVASGGTGVGASPSQLGVWRCDDGSLVVLEDVPLMPNAMAFGPNSALLVMSDGTYRALALMDVATQTVLWRVEVPEADDPAGRAPPDRRSLSSAVAWLDDGSAIVHAIDGAIRVIDPANGAVLRTLPHQGASHAIGRDADGSFLVFGHKSIDRIEARATAVTGTIAYSADAMSPSGTLLARSTDRHIEIIDRASGMTIHRLGTRMRIPEGWGNRARAFSLAANPMYPIVASGAPDGALRLWDLRAPGAPRTVWAHKAFVEAIAFDRRGRFVATGGGDGFVRIHSVRDASEPKAIEVKGLVRALCFEETDRRAVVFVATSKGDARCVDATDGTLLGEAAAILDVNAIVVSADGRIVVGGVGGLIDFDRSLKDRRELLPKQPVSALSVGPNGELAVSIGPPKWFTGYGHAVKTGTIIYPGGSTEPEHFDGETTCLRASAFDLDGQLLATAGDDGRLAVYDRATRQRRFAVDAHAGDATGVAFVADGRFIATTGMDGAVRLWSVTDGVLVATLVSLGSDDFVTVIDSGHYTATKWGLRSVMARIRASDDAEETLVPFGRFDVALNRPDRVLERLGYAGREVIDECRRSHEARLRRLGIKEDGSSAAAPRVAIIERPDEGFTHESNVTLRVRLTTEQSRTARLVVACNQVPIFGRRGREIAVESGDGSYSATLAFPVELTAGANEIEIVVIDDQDRASIAESLGFVRLCAPPRRTLWVLAVGVSHYRDGSLNLDYAAKDAVDLAHEFSLRPKTVERVCARVIVDEYATRDAILAARSFFEDTSVDDQVVVLLAGHGTIREGTYCFLPHDVERERPLDTGIRYDEIEDLLDGVKARRRLVLLDTCHAGDDVAIDAPAARQLAAGVRQVRSFAASTNRAIGVADNVATAPRRRRPVRDLFADLRRDSGSFVIAAASAIEFAAERDDLANGVFTSCVIDALRGTADRDHDGTVTVSELHRYVSERVPLMTGGAQQPVTRRENLADDFPIH